MHQDKDQSIWQEILERDPELFIMMGDGVYPDENLDILPALDRAYATAAKHEAFTAFRQAVPTAAIWDDNDYGGADVGEEFPHKAASRDRFLEFWETQAGIRRRRRDSGIYDLIELGDAASRVQVILLDLRYCRTPWVRQADEDVKALEVSGFGPFRASTAKTATMLGEAQWAWLEAVLERPAKLRLIVSSIQYLTDRGWESWSNFPNEKARLFDLIDRTGADGVLMLSGDAHFGETARLDDTPFGYPFWEFTSSGLTESWPRPGPNPERLGDIVAETNFGLLHVNWLQSDPLIVVELYNGAGERRVQHALRLSSLEDSS